MPSIDPERSVPGPADPVPSADAGELLSRRGAVLGAAAAMLAGGALADGRDARRRRRRDGRGHEGAPTGPASPAPGATGGESGDTLEAARNRKRGPTGLPGPPGMTGPTGPTAAATSTFSEAAFRIVGDADATKQLAFSLANVPASTTRVLTAPDGDTTLVGTATTQTLANKTLSSVSGAVSPLVVRGAAGQTAPLAIMQDSAGTEVARLDTDADGNIALGKAALANRLPGGYDNIAIGTLALGEATASAVFYESTAVGGFALHRSTGFQNTAVGADSLSASLTGDRNTALGAKAGMNVYEGSGNIAIGAETFIPDAAGDNQLNIGNLIFGTGLDGRWGEVSRGNIGVGVLWPQAKLDVAGDIKASGSLYTGAVTGAGSLATDAAGKIVAGASDASLKANVEPMADGPAVVAGLRPVRFDWTPEANMGDRRQVGFIAQEVREVLPEVVGERADGKLTMNYATLVAPLVGAVQALQQQVERIPELERQVAEMAARLAELEGTP